MGRNILVITGSPRKGGNTDTLAGAFIRGASAAGHAVSHFDAAATEIKPCKACDKCWSTGAPCVFKDGFNTMAPMLLKADTLVLATPVYWFGFSTQLKSAVDKFYSMVRESCPSPLRIRDAVLLLVAGDEDEAVFAGSIATYKGIADYLKWRDAGILAVPGVYAKGDIAGSPYLDKAERLGKSL